MLASLKSSYCVIHISMRNCKIMEVGAYCCRINLILSLSHSNKTKIFWKMSKNDFGHSACRLMLVFFFRHTHHRPVSCLASICTHTAVIN